MAGKQTFTMIKPSTFSANHTGAILKMINEAGFTLKAMKITKLSAEQAGAFYEVHKERPFYADLVQFMSSGPIVAGATNPANAAEGTIRKIFAINLQENAVHGSDSDENAIIESDFFFSKTERF